MIITFLINRFFELTTNNYYDIENKKYYSIGKAFSNYHLYKTEKNPLFREKDFHYTPIGVLPLHKFDDYNQKYKIKVPVFVAFDDSEAIKTYLYHFLNNTTDWSRKFNMDINIVGHYDKDIQKRIRTISRNMYVVNLFNKDFIEGILYRTESFNDNGNIIDIKIPYKFIIKNAFSRLKDLYDTTERVKKATPIMFEKEIIKNCKGMNKEELEQTLMCYIQNQNTLEKKISYFSEILNIV
jgi:hypothetical protein